MAAQAMVAQRMEPLQELAVISTLARYMANQCHLAQVRLAILKALSTSTEVAINLAITPPRFTSKKLEEWEPSIRLLTVKVPQ